MIRLREKILQGATRVLLACLVFHVSISSRDPKVLATAFAATTDTGVLARMLSAVTEERARELLGRHLPAKHFQVYAAVEADAIEQSRSVYLPSNGSLASLKGLDSASLRGYAKSVQLDIFINPKVSTTSRAKLNELLERGLALNFAAGDKIVFRDLIIDDIDAPVGASSVPSEANSVGAQQLRAIQDDLRALKFRAEDLRKERDDIKQELTLAKVEMQRQAVQKDVQPADRNVVEVNNVLPANKENASKPVTSEQTPYSDGKMGIPEFWVTAAAASLLALSVLIGLMLLGGGFRSLSSAVGASVGAIAEALENLGSALGSNQGGRAATGVGDVKVSLTRESEPRGATEVGRSRVAVENAEKRLKELRQVLAVQLSGKGETVALTQIDHLLSGKSDRSPQVEMGVAMLEVMSEDLAHRIYMKLNKQKQATVRNFMKKFSYSSAKEERLLEAGEQLKMALFAESFGELRGQLDNAVAEAVIRITDKDLAEACLKVPKEALPRLLIYCEPKRIAKILEHLKRADAKQFEAVVASVIKIPEAKFQSNFDAVLVDRLKQVLSVSESDFQREYLDFYKEIIEESGDKLRGDVAEKLATQHPKIREFIDETIITINTLFKLDSEYQEDIIEYLSNKDIAALFTSLEADQKADLLVMVDERRRELLDDDVTRLNARGKKQIEAAFEQAKRLVIERILVLKGEGTIQELMSQPKNMQNNAA